MNSVRAKRARQGLWERFINTRKINPDVAYRAAEAYMKLYSSDSDENAQLIKKWITAYEKVKAGISSLNRSVTEPLAVTSFLLERTFL
jgi:hypothetical protein